ncbi:hypothetical protein HGRIS_014141 [Hohenbuehelia grisea]|uniref:Uncharacterized protein n=1 Tax=Hohenbuehelia grisea TaxID=104357 RepID=A0ABR3JTG5_9AGAR
MHRDHVPAVPPSLELLGSSPVAYNQGMVRYASADSTGSQADSQSSRPLTDIQILTVQGHPEFTKPIVSAIVALRSSSGIFDKALADDVARRSDFRNDGVPVIGKVMWRILGIDAPVS